MCGFTCYFILCFKLLKASTSLSVSLCIFLWKNLPGSDCAALESLSQDSPWQSRKSAKDKNRFRSFGHKKKVALATFRIPLPFQATVALEVPVVLIVKKNMLRPPFALQENIEKVLGYRYKKKKRKGERFPRAKILNKPAAFLWPKALKERPKFGLFLHGNFHGLLSSYLIRAQRTAKVRMSH